MIDFSTKSRRNYIAYMAIERATRQVFALIIIALLFN